MKKLIKMIKDHEGVRHKPYYDTANPPKLTIGVGRNLDDNGLSDDEVDYLLANDIARCEAEAKTYDWYAGLNEPRKGVVISMLFNLGKPRWDKFVATQEAIANGHYALAAREMLDSRWARQVGKRSHHLAAMMESGEWK